MRPRSCIAAVVAAALVGCASPGGGDRRYQRAPPPEPCHHIRASQERAGQVGLRRDRPDGRGARRGAARASHHARRAAHDGQLQMAGSPMQMMRGGSFDEQLARQTKRLACSFFSSATSTFTTATIARHYRHQYCRSYSYGH